ncbi:hypothetical protein [Aneurinibacillus migulanus]|uniref:hypothetical protein n=1 Tax=Aneurinibacillus migulanus TaxID=47500 RepID=UPI001F3FF882|nr:hypothetical protein [Aneurinibacillus migulanus]
MINRQILVVRGKKRRKSDGWMGAVGKRHAPLSSAGSKGASNLFFFPKSPPSNHTPLSKYQV